MRYHNDIYYTIINNLRYHNDISHIYIYIILYIYIYYLFTLWPSCRIYSEVPLGRKTIIILVTSVVNYRQPITDSYYLI